MRLPREQYAVGEVEHPNGMDVTVGIYYDVPATEDIEELTHIAQSFGREALGFCGGNHEAVKSHVEMLVDTNFPGRPFYVETREGGRGVQVYQPYGMPQDEPPKRLGRLPDHES